MCNQKTLHAYFQPNVICSGVIESKAKTLNINEKYVILERNEEDQVFVENDATIVTRDIMGTNGVIHM